MSPVRRFSRLAALGLALVFALSTACGGGDAIEQDDDTMDQGELRKRSEDLFKPTSKAVQIVPATLRNLVHWELYASERGTTVIGRSANKKAKAIFVQLVDPKRGEVDRASMRGSGYLVASDFRLDTRSKKNELKLLADAIQKDFKAALERADEPPTTPAPTEPPPPAEPPAPTGSPDGADGAVVPAPPAPTETAQPVKPCVRSILKTVLFGIELLGKVTTTLVEGAYCVGDPRNDCSAAVAAFDRTVALTENFDAKTCR